MKKINQVLFFTFLTVCTINCQKDADESKPYEFGFTIDGQEHRHEKKDEKGIIQGEFGFITADGIYHVTVYATDENGKFKILSTRNLRISAPLDGSPLRGEISPEANKYREQANLPPLPSPEAVPNALSLPSSSQPPSQPPRIQQQVQDTATTKVFYKFTTPSTVKPACAGCGYVTTPKTKPGKSPFEFQPSILPKPGQFEQGIEAFGQPQKLPSSSSFSGNLRSDIQQGQNIESVVDVEKVRPSKPVIFNRGLNNSQQNSGGLQTPSQSQQSPDSPYNTLTQATDYSKGPIDSSKSSNFSQQKNSTQQVAFGYQHLQDQQNFSQGLDNTPSGGSSPTYQISTGPQTTNYGSISGGQGFLPSPGNFIRQQKYQSEQKGLLPGSQQRPGSLPNILEANPLRLPGQGSQTPESRLPPVSVSGGVIHVGGDKQQNIPIKDKFPGMSDGLPEGIEEKDITNLLYKFHYFVGFHGHYEKGLKNGAKIGGYFVNGRDGISRVVTYIADENGYRPKVKFINLALDSDETPKAETEKTFGLKSFEFVWYPL